MGLVVEFCPGEGQSQSRAAHSLVQARQRAERVGFDTSQPGNSNIGHSGEAFGSMLPEDQKSAVLEYLKKLVAN